MTFMEKLRKKKPSSTVAYHLDGLLEAQENIRSLLSRLGEDSTSDLESTAATMTDLREEIYTHLAYHMKELRRPLRRMIDRAYSKLPDLGEDETFEWPPAPPGGNT